VTGYWTETRPNGKPIEPGTVCWVTETPGINPIYTYGRDQQEVIEKLSLNQAHSQAALARRNAPTPIPAATTPAPVRPAMTADEVMQATADLANPGKSGAAIVKLVQDASGVDLSRVALDDFARTAQQWEADNPDFFPHPGNKRLLVDQAKAHVGGSLARITAALLTQSFHELLQAGLLYDAPANPNPTPNNLEAFPGENPVQRTERPRGARYATGTRSTSFRAPQQASQTRTLKYTAEEISRMPESKSRALIAANDRDYAEACEFHFGAQATA
jgi:hypothetical protein